MRVDPLPQQLLIEEEKAQDQESEHILEEEAELNDDQIDELMLSA